jgi:hypothetical protein
MCAVTMVIKIVMVSGAVLSVNCSSAPEVSDAMLTYDSATYWLYKDAVTYSCAEGYSAVNGLTNKFCGLSSLWEGEVECRRKFYGIIH